MERPKTDSRNYFSPYYFARDYLYSAAAVSVAGVAGVILSGQFGWFVDEILGRPPTAGMLLAAMLFLFLCHGLGQSANSLVVAVTSLFTLCIEKVPTIFDVYYKRYEMHIAEVYAKRFPGEFFLLNRKKWRGARTQRETGNKVAQLIEFCRQHEAAGYMHVARLYAVIAFNRQLSLYFLVLGIGFCGYWNECWTSGFQWWAVAVSFTVCAYLVYTQWRLVGEASHLELTFISATDARLDREERLGRKSGGTPNGKDGMREMQDTDDRPD